MRGVPPTICPCCGLDLVPDEPLSIGPLSIDVLGDLVFDGKPCGLPIGVMREIVSALIKANGRIIERDAMMNRIGSNAGGKVMDVYMHRIRKYLRPHGLDDLFQTVWGRGFRFNPDHPAIRSVSA